MKEKRIFALQHQTRLRDLVIVVILVRNSVSDPYNGGTTLLLVP